MAKVKSPLFGFDASGQLAKTLVYMKWKGINDVRQHVIPANPNTAAQQAQRAFIADCVALWHSTGWTPNDLTAWNRYAGVKPRPMSGYNAFSSDFINAKVAGKTAFVLWDLSVVSAVAGQAVVSVKTDSSITLIKVRYGVSKTAMYNTDDLVESPAGTYTVTISALVEGARYFFQVYMTYPNYAGNTGIDQCDIMST
jgi:hypothetical protein